MRRSKIGILFLAKDECRKFAEAFHVFHQGSDTYLSDHLFLESSSELKEYFDLYLENAYELTDDVEGHKFKELMDEYVDGVDEHTAIVGSYLHEAMFLILNRYKHLDLMNTYATIHLLRPETIAITFIKDSK